MELILYIDDNDIYKKIKKNKDKDIYLKLKQQDRILDIKDINSLNDMESKWILYSIIAANIKNLEKRYSYIYDVVCDYLDKEFSKKNICQFKNNKCIGVEKGIHCKESLYGCCYGRTRGICIYLKNGKCTIKSISCKLFVCSYLRKNNIKYNTNNIPLLKYFFSRKQKRIIEESLFIDKDIVINKLLKS